jgi:twitching motility two-component system response regulator PilH
LARRILLADDSVTAQNMGRRILSDAGYEVITVNNGSAALKKVSEQAPDVIVLDVYMPGYGGLEVCQRLKEVAETARIPILLTVGKLEPFKPDEARRVRADAFIIKPFEATELLATLTKLEDKIVPQSDAPKGGKARSFASSEGVHSEEETGWKNRLSIPPGGKGRTPGGLEADDFGQRPQIEPAGKKHVKDETGREAPVAVENSPASNAAGTQLASGVAATETAATGQVKADEPQTEPAAALVPVAVEKESSPETAVASQPDVVAPQTGSEPKDEISSPAAVASESEQIPTAIAEAASRQQTSGGPRWVAESVALSSADTAFPLEGEMEKSLAAGAAFDAGRAMVAETEVKDQRGAPVPATEIARETTEPAAVSASAEADTVQAATDEGKAVEIPSRSEETVSARAAEIPAEASRVVEAVSEVVSQPKPEAYAAAAAMGSNPSASVPVEESSGNKQQLAEAWEQWQNVRDTVLNSPVAEQITEAAAASLKNGAPLESGDNAASAPSNPTAIASIVDSVLAELKPKLMEEIAKKLSNEKKDK